MQFKNGLRDITSNFVQRLYRNSISARKILRAQI
jgi:hypothetical protein